MVGTVPLKMLGRDPVSAWKCWARRLKSDVAKVSPVKSESQRFFIFDYVVTDAVTGYQR